MSVLALLFELNCYHDLLPHLQEQHPGHAEELRSLPLRILTCLGKMAPMPMTVAEATALRCARRTVLHACDEAMVRPLPWSSLYHELQQALAPWPELLAQASTDKPVQGTEAVLS